VSRDLSRKGKVISIKIVAIYAMIIIVFLRPIYFCTFLYYLSQKILTKHSKSAFFVSGNF